MLRWHASWRLHKRRCLHVRRCARPPHHRAQVLCLPACRRGQAAAAAAACSGRDDAWLAISCYGRCQSAIWAADAFAFGEGVSCAAPVRAARSSRHDSAMGCLAAAGHGMGRTGALGVGAATEPMTCRSHQTRRITRRYLHAHLLHLQTPDPLIKHTHGSHWSAGRGDRDIADDLWESSNTQNYTALPACPSFSLANARSFDQAHTFSCSSKRAILSLAPRTAQQPVTAVTCSFRNTARGARAGGVIAHTPAVAAFL
eukprot:COSAG01_NODE_482_length_16412_cov_47.760130_5_plen_257_part_00